MRMKWTFCNNSESYEMLSRDEDGKICASIFIDDTGIIGMAIVDGKTYINEFEKGANLLEVERKIKEQLGI